MKLDHLFTLTDHIAVLQHAKFAVPARREGYTVDDNARALVLAAKAQSIWPSEKLLELQRKLLAFILLMQSENGKLHNLMDYSQRILDEPFTGDHLGRVIWATGTVINSSLPAGMKGSARLIFDRALPWARESASPRTKAYACLGLAERLRSQPNDRNLSLNLKHIADTLLKQYTATSTPGWEWFENSLTYDNARMSQALLVAHQTLGDQAFLSAGLDSLSFLAMETTKDAIFVPIGSNGWYMKGGERALYDQQPVDTGAMVETVVLAHKLTQLPAHEKTLRQALGWFFGLNTKCVEVYDNATGACYDGITAEGLNENQGSESTVAFLLAAAVLIETYTQSL